MRNSWTAICVLMLAFGARLYAVQGSAEQPVATIETSAGNLTCVLFPKAAPAVEVSADRNWNVPTLPASRPLVHHHFIVSSLCAASLNRRS